MTLFREMIKVFVDAELGAPARSAFLARTAREYVGTLVTSGRASPRYFKTVDGRRGAEEETVSGDRGVIVYDFNYVGDAAEFAIAFLIGRSPVGDGSRKSAKHPKAYRDCFEVAINGRPVSAAGFNKSSVPLDAEIIIYNTQPYSRKVDVQLVGRRALVFSTPPGIFDDAVRAINRQFGNAAKAKRVYNINFAGKYLLQNHQFRTDRPHRVNRSAGTPVESPAIIINGLR